MEYIVPALVLVVIVVSIVAWLTATGGAEGVAEAELSDGGLIPDLPATFDAPGRRALATIVTRHPPLVRVSRGPRLGQAWLRYADGTRLLVEEPVIGAIGLLAVDIAWHGPADQIAVAATDTGCWATVGRRKTKLRLLSGQHPEMLIAS